MPNELLTDLQEANSSFRCGTCPGGPEEECDDQCDKHRLEFMAEELGKKGWATVAWCTKCKHYDDCPKWLGGCMEENLFYCSSGEPKEGE